MRAFVVGVVLTGAGCLASAVMLGYAGLSRGISVGPIAMWREHLLALGAFAVLAGLVGLVAGRVLQPLSHRGLAGVLIGVLVAYASISLLASIAVGEIEIEHSPEVIAVVSGLGLWPLVAASGALAFTRWQRHRPLHGSG